MHRFRKIQNQHLFSMLLLLVVFLYTTKGEMAMPCAKVIAKKSTMVLSSSTPGQEFGLKPIHIQIISDHYPQNTNLLLREFKTGQHVFIPKLKTKDSCIHFNGHQGTLGIIALLYPFHGFT